MEPHKEVESTNTITALGNGAVRVQPFVCKLPSERRKERKSIRNFNDDEEQVTFTKEGTENSSTNYYDKECSNNAGGKQPLLTRISDRGMALQGFIDKSKDMYDDDKDNTQRTSVCVLFLSFGLLISLVGLIFSYFKFMT
mmetsp:Transcript_19819/g.22103  ORF Transcript_19819/g.22103 Transcript_19819/m.22103 type:complete len:140 (-) Transcript_19819:63-482(-)